MLEFLKHKVIDSDILSSRPELRTDEKNIRFKTLFGGCLTILCSLMIISASISFGIDLIKRKNSTITYNLLPADDSTIEEVGQYPFMVALLDNGLKLLEDEDRYYYFLSETWDFIPDDSSGQLVMKLKRTPIKTERCDIDKHFGKYREIFKNVPYLSHHYCLIPGQNITTYGLYGSTKAYNFIDHWISTCVNDTNVNRTNCHPTEKSKARLVNTYISFVFLDYSINHNNIYDPIKVNLRSEILPVSSTIYKRIFFYQRPVSYKTDYGLILEDLYEEKFFQTSDSKENVDLRPQGTVPGSFALISVMMDKYNNFYSRKYYKIQNFLADIGGIVKGFLVISTFLNYIFSEEFYYVNLINSLYSIDIIKKKNKKIFEYSNMSLNDNNLSNIRKINVKDIGKIKKFQEEFKLDTKKFQRRSQIEGVDQPKESQNYHDSHDNLGDLKNQKDDKKLDLKLTIWEIILPSICFNKKNLNLQNYILVKNYVLRMISLKDIIKRTNEVDKLKTFIFNSDLINLYENTPNPSLSKLKHNTNNIWTETYFNFNDLLPSGFEEKMNLVKTKYDKNFLEKNIIKISGMNC